MVTDSREFPFGGTSTYIFQVLWWDIVGWAYKSTWEGLEMVDAGQMRR